MWSFDLTLDANTMLPFVFVAFGITMLGLSVRLMALRIHPYQRSSDAAFFIPVMADIGSWLLRSVFTSSEKMQILVSSFLSPAGPYYMTTVFMPQQICLLLSLCFRGDLPFHALLYSIFLLTSMTFIYTHFSLYLAVNDRFFLTSKNMTASTVNPPDSLLNLIPQEGNLVCQDESVIAQSLLAICAVLILTAAYRSHRDRVNGILLLYSLIGINAWANCAKNNVPSGIVFVIVEVLSYVFIKVRTMRWSLEESAIEDRKFKYYREISAKDVKKVAMVLDGFIGPDAVICGISRSYEAWIVELARQGVDVVIFSAFNKDSIENYFANIVKQEGYQNPGKISAEKIDALDIKYVSQIYYATRCNLRNVLNVSNSFHREKPDVVHVVFDGTSAPIFSWACALLRVPIVGIMHTDSIVICERNGFKLLSPIILMAQKMCGTGLESIATRSKSFKEEMLRLRNWKCDKVIKPHVRTEIFKVIKNDEIIAIRKKLTFNEKGNVKYDEKTKSFNDGKFVMLYAGRFDVDKRVDELVEIMKKLKEMGRKNVYLAMIGGGSLVEDVMQLHGDDFHVYCQSTFLTHEDLAKYYNAADIHVSASQMETLGNTVLESMACGTPVVVPRAQGFVDSVTEDETGVFWEINTGKSVDNAVGKIVELLDHPENMRKLKDGAVDKIRNLTCESTVEDLIKWYAEASEIRRTKTMFFPRLLMSSFLLLGLFLFDLLIFQHAKKVLQSFSDREVRARNREQLLNQE